MRFIPLIISILIHLIIFLFILDYSIKIQKKDKPKEFLVEVTFVTKSQPLSYEEKLVKIRKEESQYHNKEPDVKFVKNCDNKHSYIGIGLQYFPDGRVSDIAPGYAADRAGIKVGDRIKNPMDIKRIGDYEYITIIRDFKEIKFKIKLERVCIEIL